MKNTRSTPNQPSRPDKPLWCFLGEFPLGELNDHGTEETASIGTLYQTIRDLGIPQECQYPIIQTLTDCAQLAMVHDRPGTPVVIRLFCQERISMDENPAEPMRPKPAVSGKEIIQQAQPNINGGWGYFLVERMGDSPINISGGLPYIVDLYLYQEEE